MEKTTLKTTAFDWGGSRGERWSTQVEGMEATLRPVDAPLLRALRLEGPCRIADVGCGGGGTAREILRASAAGSVVHGFDLSPKLVEVARERGRPHERDEGDEREVVFEVADVSAAAPEVPYDRLVSRFGVMFFDDPQAAFANLRRWLLPKGRFAFAVWGRPTDNPWLATAREQVARVVTVPAMDPEAPGPFRYANVLRLLGLLEAAGLAELEVQDWRGSLPIGGGLPPSEAARFALASFSNFAELLATAGQEAFDEAHRSLTDAYAEHVHDGSVRMDACVRLVTGGRS